MQRCCHLSKVTELVKDPILECTGSLLDNTALILISFRITASSWLWHASQWDRRLEFDCDPQCGKARGKKKNNPSRWHLWRPPFSAVLPGGGVAVSRLRTPIRLWAVKPSRHPSSPEVLTLGWGFLGQVLRSLWTLWNYVWNYVCVHFSEERVTSFHQIIKWVCDSKKLPRPLISPNSEPLCKDTQGWEIKDLPFRNFYWVPSMYKASTPECVEDEKDRCCSHPRNWGLFFMTWYVFNLLLVGW